MKNFFLVLTTITLLLSCDTLTTNNIFVTNESELKEALKNSKAGDDIVLKDGTYKDVELEFYGKGTENNPITLRAENPGKVFIEGNSNLEIGGEYLVVKDLHFRNGYTTKKHLIRFKINDDKIAFHSKITNCVIEEFTQLDRDVTDHWVEFWGQHNELSNNYIAGKSNFGPTVMVMLKGNQHINNHQIYIRPTTTTKDRHARTAGRLARWAAAALAHRRQG